MANRPQSAEDPAVGLVEQVLRSATHPADPHDLAREHPDCEYALVICACATDLDAPTWLIAIDTDNGLLWARIPDATNGLDLVHSQHVDVQHSEPDTVLAWLREETDLEPTPRGASRRSQNVAENIRDRIRNRTALPRGSERSDSSPESWLMAPVAVEVVEFDDDRELLLAMLFDSLEGTEPKQLLAWSKKTGSATKRKVIEEVEVALLPQGRGVRLRGIDLDLDDVLLTLEEFQSLLHDHQA